MKWRGRVKDISLGVNSFVVKNKEDIMYEEVEYLRYFRRNTKVVGGFDEYFTEVQIHVRGRKKPVVVRACLQTPKSPPEATHWGVRDYVKSPISRLANGSWSWRRPPN